MSSRLLTMKRAAASSPPSTPTPPPAKKQRLSNGAPVPSGTTPDLPSPRPSRRETSQERVVREVLAAEEARRDEALERLAREKGETRWALSTAYDEAGGGGEEEGPGFRTVGMGEIDREEEEEVGSGRRTFGRPLPKVRGRPEEGESGSESGSESESGEEEAEDVDAMIQRGRSDAAERARRELKEKRGERGRQGSRMAAERREKGVNLNSSRGPRGGGGISSGGGSRGGSSGKRKSY